MFVSVPRASSFHTGPEGISYTRTPAVPSGPAAQLSSFVLCPKVVCIIKDLLHTADCSWLASRAQPSTSYLYRTVL